MKLFIPYKTYTKKNGIIVTKFKPNTDVYIKSINLESGEISDKKVTEYSKHENIKMYKIHSLDNLFRDFWVSEDHSLIVYDSKDTKYIKISPEKVIKEKDRYSLVQELDQKKRLINLKTVDIIFDSDRTIGYDFTVEDNYTFCTDDGVFVQDTMALYAPITKEAIEEAKDKMIVSTSPSGMNQMSDDFSKDIVIGIYSLTKDSDQKNNPVVVKDESDLSKMGIYDIVKYGSNMTTVGRIMFNNILPEKERYINEPINKKKISSLALKIYNNYDKKTYIDFTHNLIELGMRYYTLVAPSFTMDDLKIPLSIIKLKENLKGTTVEEADKIIKEMEKQLADYLVKSGSNLGLIGEAGGLKGGYSQTRQILVAKGLIQDSAGKPLPPIQDSYSDGLSSKEYFDSGIGARTGIINRVINTADTGYLSRQLVYALQRVEADPGIRDCGTKRYFKLFVTPDIAKRLMGRYVVVDEKKVLFNSEEHTNQVIEIRSPIYCLSDRICYTCYGELLLRNRTHYVGVLAGHLLGEPLTQSIMRQFHSGGSVSLKTVDVIPIITKLLTNKEKAKVSQILSQKNSDIVSQLNGKIVLTIEDYLDPKKDILIDKENIVLKYGYFDLYFGDFKIESTLDTQVKISVKDKKVETTDKTITIHFPASSVIFSVPPTSEAFTQQVKIVNALLSGRKPWKSADHFVMKIYDFYKDLRFLDMVHFEVLASNLLRDKGNPSYPARLNKKYQPIVGSLKNIPALESWLQSLNFENINKSITQGLIYDRPKQETILERIVTGNL